MNKRIQELADKAAENLHKSSGQTWGYNPKFAEELSKLIVKECVDIVDNADMSNLEGSDPKDVLYAVSTQIKQQFGFK